MTQFTCPDGHASTTASECSVCGATMDDQGGPGGKPAATAAPAGASAGSGSATASSSAAKAALCSECPSCQAPRENDSDEICPNCGADYASGALELPPAAVPPAATVAPPLAAASGGRPAISAPATELPATELPVGIPGSTGSAPLPTAAGETSASTRTASKSSARATLIAVVTVDTSPREGRPDDEPLPSDQSEHIFELTGPFISFGRGKAAHIIIQEDGGVSRMQGEFVLLPDGSYGVRDGMREADGSHKPSANGTEVNGKACVGSEVRRVKEGDVISVGFFHRIEIRAAVQS